MYNKARSNNSIIKKKPVHNNKNKSQSITMKTKLISNQIHIEPVQTTNHRSLELILSQIQTQSNTTRSEEDIAATVLLNILF